MCGKQAVKESYGGSSIYRGARTGPTGKMIFKEI